MHHGPGDIYQAERDIVIYESARPLPVPRQLPSAPHDFTGRADDLRALDAVLAVSNTTDSRAVVVSALSGTPGIGKTGLVVHWAHRVRSEFPDGDLYVDLRGYATGSPMSAGEVLDGFLRAFDLPTGKIPSTVDGKAALLRTILTGQRVLLVLDNAYAVDQLTPLLPGSPGSLVVVTSRNRLASLASYARVYALLLHPLPQEDARLLFLRMVPEAASADPAALDRLLEHCAGLPLAVRILASRVASRTPAYGPQLIGRLLESLGAELEDERGRLDGLALDDGTQAVRTVFSWSYRSLDPDRSAAFRHCGLHPGPTFSGSVAAAMLGVPAVQAGRTLRRLIGASLLEETGPDRYRIHDLLRTYAEELSAAEDDPAARHNVLGRLLAWYLSCADVVDQALAPHRRPVPIGVLPQVGDLPVIDTHAAALEWADEERQCFTSVTRLAVREELDVYAWQLPAALFSYFNLKKTWAVWIETHVAGLAATRRVGAREGESWLLNCLGIAYYDLQRMGQARACYEQALALRRLIHDEYGSGATLLNLGAIYWAQMSYGTSIGYYVQALELFRRIHERWGEAMILNNLSAVYRDLGQPEEAVAYALRALKIWREIGDRRGEGMTLNHLGEHHMALHDYDAADAFLREALIVREQIADDWGRAMTLRTMGTVHLARRRTGDARRAFTVALAVLDEIRDPAAADVRERLAALDTEFEA